MAEPKAVKFLGPDAEITPVKFLGPDAPLEGVDISTKESPSVLGAAVEPFKRAGSALMNLPGQVAEGVRQAPQIDWTDLLKHPGPIAETIAPSILPAIGGTLGTLVQPGAGTVAGAIGGQLANEGIKQLWSGQPQAPLETLTQGATTGILSTLGAKIPKAAANAPGAIVRKTASSESRMEAGARMMERIPGKFNVTDDLVDTKYATAEGLASRATATAPASNFLQELQTAHTKLGTNPVEALRKAAGEESLRSVIEDMYYGTPNLMRPEQMNAVIKSVNKLIRSTTGEERGLWKQVLGGIHRDARSAFSSTGEPAFGAFSDAIQSARLNFLRQDLEEAIRRVGIPMNRTGSAPITSPGKVINWIENHPDWVEKMEKAQPGLVDSIRKDLADVVPISNTVAAGIPGGNFGSGRYVLGASIGHFFRNILGLGPGSAEALGAVAASFAKRGVNWNPSTVERAFTKPPRGPSGVGGVAGASIRGQEGESQ